MDRLQEIFDVAALATPEPQVSPHDTFGKSPRQARTLRRLDHPSDSGGTQSGPRDYSSVGEGDQTESQGGVSAAAPNSPEIEHSAFVCIGRGTKDRLLVTFIELDGYPILRVSVMKSGVDTETTDLILNNDQVKLLLRQMTLWLTR